MTKIIVLNLVLNINPACLPKEAEFNFLDLKIIITPKDIHKKTKQQQNYRKLRNTVTRQNEIRVEVIMDFEKINL